MSEVKFTPGPWVAENSSVIGPDGEVLVCCVLGAVFRDDLEEDYSTAKLISAAPDLYESLQSLLGALDDNGS